MVHLGIYSTHSKFLWRWYTHMLDTYHRPVICFKTCFGSKLCFHHQVKLWTLLCRVHWMKYSQIPQRCVLTKTGEQSAEKITVPAEEEIIQYWIDKLHTEELHNLYCSFNIISVIQSRLMTKLRLISTHVEDAKCIQTYLVEKLQGKKALERLSHK
jgi:hypothetical protein